MSLTLGQETLDALAAQAGGSANVTFHIEPYVPGADDLTDEARDILGDAELWRISVSIGDGAPMVLPGKVEVFLPYAAGPGEDTGLTVFALDVLGGVAKLSGAAYDSVRGGFVFTAAGPSEFFISKNVAKLVTDYVDVKKADWYYPGVRFMTEEGLMKGITEDIFDPNGTVSRAMLVTILYRSAGSPAVDGTSAFTDVAGDEWYADAVAWAAAQGIVEGYGDGTFGPHEPVNRQALATILYRFAAEQEGIALGEADLEGFDDAGDIAPWALTAMRWAVAQGLITGRTDTLLAPEGHCTRAEAATIFMRFAALAD